MPQPLSHGLTTSGLCAWIVWMPRRCHLPASLTCLGMQRVAIIVDQLHGARMCE
jgi:hypothetical protein